MKRTFVTVMPNHIGAFLKASRVFSDLGVNLTRVSYNKAVDSHCLFIDAEGTESQLEQARERLEEIGYLQNPGGEKSVILMEFRLRDIPGSVTPLLERIEDYGLNISFISSQENGSDYQLFKMGFITDDLKKINAFRREAEQLCEVRVIDYNHADKIYDNSIFYSNFVNQLVSIMQVDRQVQETLLVNVNLAMQELDESGVSPYRTFDSISRFAELLAKAKGEKFAPRISRSTITDNTEILLIEPPCGSNTAIVKSNGQYLFVDTGYACYETEMYDIFRRLIPEFDTMPKVAFITHADVDHCGLTPKFDKVYASRKSAECLRLEYRQEDGFRERNRLHKPYITICKELTRYRPTPEAIVETVGEETANEQPLSPIGTFSFGELNFEAYEGSGGHLPGETVLIDREHRLVFSGDIFVNMKNMTPEQVQYNRYAPILMTSVDTDPKLCAQERRALLELLGQGQWHIFGGHGAEMLYTGRESHDRDPKN